MEDVETAYRQELIDICLDTIQDARDKNNNWHVIAISRDTIAKLTELIEKADDCDFHNALCSYDHWLARGNSIKPSKIVILEIDYSRDEKWVTYIEEDMPLEYYSGCSVDHLRENYFPHRSHSKNERPKVILPEW
jgi:hypothetical protein